MVENEKILQLPSLSSFELSSVLTAASAHVKATFGLDIAAAYFRLTRPVRAVDPGESNEGSTLSPLVVHARVARLRHQLSASTLQGARIMSIDQLFEFERQAPQFFARPLSHLVGAALSEQAYLGSQLTVSEPLREQGVFKGFDWNCVRSPMQVAQAAQFAKDAIARVDQCRTAEPRRPKQAQGAPA